MSALELPGIERMMGAGKGCGWWSGTVYASEWAISRSWLSGRRRMRWQCTRIEWQPGSDARTTRRFATRWFARRCPFLPTSLRDPDRRVQGSSAVPPLRDKLGVRAGVPSDSGARFGSVTRCGRGTCVDSADRSAKDAPRPAPQRHTVPSVSSAGEKNVEAVTQNAQLEY